MKITFGTDQILTSFCKRETKRDLLLPDFNPRLQRFDGSLSHSCAVRCPKMCRSIHHYTQWVKRCVSIIVGLICHFFEVPNCVRLHIFGKDRDVEVPVWSWVLMNSTWEICNKIGIQKEKILPRACRTSCRIIPILRQSGDPRLTACPLSRPTPPTLPVYKNAHFLYFFWHFFSHLRKRSNC